ncbi:2,5-diamino-6-(ribosylamino)-4(3H)-pyrimidinone 5'-phosphate reductase [Diatrype stigma]|uniref:2,5-diamino-6-ribosylamino-4(3H)-pyrimidinone 5'-phosphate reductase n=1 Tax=Diatrype stigma TaxID=117547 RepID=A0AAN9V102_9PEZI
MTHYLRSRHDAICVGVGTAIADDPGLNCRIAPVPAPAVADIPNGKAAVAPTPTPFPGSVVTGQPRPVVIDPQLRWDLTSQSKVMQLARAGQGLAPYIITSVSEPPAARRSLLEEHGGKFLLVQQTPDARDGRQRFDWRTILAAVRAEGLRSIMIEGGGEVINSLLSPENNELIDSVIVTIAPTWLGRGGVVVSPPRQLGEGDGGGGDGKGEGKGARPPPGPAARLANPTWLPLGEDVVLCGRIAK